jgi:hypothetical protein
VTTKDDFFDGVDFVLWSEERAKARNLQTRSKKDEVKFRNRLCGLLAEVRSSGDMNLITQTDKLINRNDLEKYATSKRQVSSLQNGLDDLTAIGIGIECLKDTETYKKSSVAYFQQKVHDSQGLPKDPARIAFRSHLTRLENLDASKADESEKAVSKERMLIFVLRKGFTLRNSERFWAWIRRFLRKRGALPRQRSWFARAGRRLNRTWSGRMFGLFGKPREKDNSRVFFFGARWCWSRIC